MHHESLEIKYDGRFLFFEEKPSGKQVFFKAVTDEATADKILCVYER